jgi:hypothetical protein
MEQLPVAIDPGRIDRQLSRGQELAEMVEGVGAHGEAAHGREFVGEAERCLMPGAGFRLA